MTTSHTAPRTTPRTTPRTDLLQAAGLEILSAIDWPLATNRPAQTLALLVGARVYPLTIMRQNEATASDWAALARAGHRVIQTWINDPARANRLWLGVCVDGQFKPYPCTPADFGL